MVEIFISVFILTLAFVLFCFVLLRLSLLSRTRKHADPGDCMNPFVRPLTVHAISRSPLMEPVVLQIHNKHVF